MADTTTINITTEQHERLEQRKQHPNEAFADVVERLLDGDGDDAPTTADVERGDLQAQLDRIEAAAGVDPDDVRVAVESGVENALPDGVGR
jgi:hypothetical protein